MSAIKNYKIMIVITIYNLKYDINIFMFRKDNNTSYSWVQIKFLKSKLILFEKITKTLFNHFSIGECLFQLKKINVFDKYQTKMFRKGK